jgi:hypothetical protein
LDTQKASKRTYTKHNLASFKKKQTHPEKGLGNSDNTRKDELTTLYIPTITDLSLVASTTGAHCFNNKPTYVSVTTNKNTDKYRSSQQNQIPSLNSTKTKNRNMINTKTFHQTQKESNVKSTDKIASGYPEKSQRRIARVVGGALLLMAILAGISIPALGTLTASIGLVGIFLLDILVSIGIYRYHTNRNPILAKITSILRLLYTLILGIGIGYHVAGNVPMFNKVWGIGLIAFGIHLIALGILFNNEGGKKWINILIKSLLIIAGIAYVIQYVGILLVANPIGFAALIESIFIVPMILGEVFYALWMLIKGGKVKSKQS